ncbi:MAG: iron-sulfur cluster repair di-iron protein [Chthoniobacterales bacterium]
MSHHTPTMSPAGTPLADRTVGELVAESPGLSRVFQKHHLDFCCQGAKTVREACEKKGLVTDEIVTELENASKAQPEDEKNPAELSPAELADYIIERHHGFLVQELPRLHAMAQRVAQVHGGHTPSLIELFHVFDRLFVELSNHMAKEEQVLFPAIKKLAGEDLQEGTFSGPLATPIAMMRHEHDDTGADLEKLHELTKGYHPPPEACNTYRALFAGLADLDSDLHVHIHLENSVLFPAAEKLAAQAA